MSLGKLLFVANANIPSLQLSFLTPLRLEPSEGKCSLLTEQDLSAALGKTARGPAGAEWVRERLVAFTPELIVFCRYSGPHASAIVEWARERSVPAIFHLDDDLLNVPLELGPAKHAMHNHPDRLAAVRYLLDEATLVYCSTEPLRRRLFGEAPTERVVAGAVYCAHPVRAEPTTGRLPKTVGYMGFDHAHDFTLALPALVRLLDARPELPFEMFGSIPVPEELKRFGDRIRTIEPVRSYPDFTAKLASLGWTIGICPLAKTPFNEVKADTKWVEYTASGFATIASRNTVYDACCADGCGILADNEAEWFAAFEHLLDDEAAHRAQVERAQEKLRRAYSPERLAEQIESVFAQAHALVRAFSGPVPAASTVAASADAATRETEQPTRFHVDLLADDGVVGWAWTEKDRGRSEGEPIEIRCGNVRLGWCLRRLARPDADAHLAEFDGTKGFSLPVGCLIPLSRLLDDPPGLHPTARLADEAFPLHGTGADLNDLSAFRTLRTLDGGYSLHVADLWWGNSRLLKVRSLETPATARQPGASVLRVYQPLRASDGAVGLTQVDELALSADQAIHPIGVRSPYMPLLLVGCTEAGEICFTDLVPFPSLLRGGPHEAEVSAMGDEAGSLPDLRRLSDAYLAEFLGTGGQLPALALAGIDIDLTEIIGTEPVFDPTLREWLSAVLRIPLAAANAETRVERDLGDRSFVDHAVAQLQRTEGSAAREGLVRLSLASAAVPTVAGLVSRRALAAGAAFAPHIVTDPSAPTKRWFVALPDGGPLAGASDLGRIAGRRFPRLQWVEEAGREQDADRQLPLAILFRDLAPPEPAELVFPVPRDEPAILPEVAVGASPRVSVVLLIRDIEQDPRLLLASIAAQITAGDCEVVLGATAHDWGLDPIRRSLSELLPDRSHIVAGLDSRNTSDALNVLASRATGDVLVLVDESAILHDDRTLDTLARLAVADGVGTIGCMQVKAYKPGDSRHVVKSAGLFPGRCDFTAQPALALQELPVGSILPRAIYPVAANAAHCMSVSMTVWRDFGGFNAKLPLHDYANVDLAVRLAEAGRANLCTTLLSVYADDRGRPARGLNVYAALSLGLWKLLPAVKASTLVRSF